MNNKRPHDDAQVRREDYENAKTNNSINSNKQVEFGGAVPLASGERMTARRRVKAKVQHRSTPYKNDNDSDKKSHRTNALNEWEGNRHPFDQVHFNTNTNAASAANTTPAKHNAHDTVNSNWFPTATTPTMQPNQKEGPVYTFGKSPSVREPVTPKTIAHDDEDTDDEEPMTTQNPSISFAFGGTGRTTSSANDNDNAFFSQAANPSAATAAASNTATTNSFQPSNSSNMDPQGQQQRVLMYQQQANQMEHEFQQTLQSKMRLGKGVNALALLDQYIHSAVYALEEAYYKEEAIDSTGCAMGHLPFRPVENVNVVKGYANGASADNEEPLKPVTATKPRSDGSWTAICTLENIHVYVCPPKSGTDQAPRIKLSDGTLKIEERVVAEDNNNNNNNNNNNKTMRQLVLRNAASGTVQLQLQLCSGMPVHGQINPHHKFAGVNLESAFFNGLRCPKMGVECFVIRRRRLNDDAGKSLEQILKETVNNF